MVHFSLVVGIFFINLYFIITLRLPKELIKQTFFGTESESIIITPNKICTYQLDIIIIVNYFISIPRARNFRL